MHMEKAIQTDRLTITPFDLKNLRDYCAGFDIDVTKYQYPEPFATEADAQEALQSFMDLMDQGEMLFLSVFTKDGVFIGSVEVHGLKEAVPELGIWLRKEYRQRGYAYEALQNVMEVVDKQYQKEWYVYEADIRNDGSIKLAEKFIYRKDSFDAFSTESGKELKLQKFFIKLR